MLTLVPMLALALAPQGADTTLQVRQGDRLQAHVFAGTLHVEGWDRNTVQVTGVDGRSRSVTYNGTTVRVQLNPGRYSNGVGDVRIRVPAWMAVEASGVETSLTVLRVNAEVKLNTVEGDVIVEGGSDKVSARSVDGDVSVTGARGRVEAGSVDGDVTLRNVSGDVRIESVDGHIDVQGSDLSGLEATRQLRTAPETADTPIIVVTSFALAGDEQKARQAGAAAYLAKPYSPRELLGMIRELAPEA